jgi:sugar phosphate isomerase/epimerase
MRKKQTRRDFLQLAAGAALLGRAGSCLGDEQSKAERGGQLNKGHLKLGMASYTFRKFGLDETLAMTKRLGLEYIALKSFHLPLESTTAAIETAAAKVKAAGLVLYGGGVIYMNDEAEVNRAFDYAKAAGMNVIIGVPKPELLGLVNEKVAQYDIKVAIHNHGPEDKVYPTPQSAYEKIKELDKRIGLCLDVGHAQRAGVDPSQAARQYADRLLDVHIKDVSAATAEGTTVEMGRGVIDIPKFVKTLLDIKPASSQGDGRGLAKGGYTGIASFEFEKDEQDPLAGVAESVGYVRGILATI